MEKEGTGAEARCAEFMAGNEGGGRVSSASSSEESRSVSRVKIGTAGAFAASSAVAFGVDCGESCGEMSDPFRGAFCLLDFFLICSSCVSFLCMSGVAVLVPSLVECARRVCHVEGG